MSRKLCLCALVLGLAFGAARVRAQDTAPKAEQDESDDGPAPVNTEESLTAGASDDLSGSQQQPAPKPQAATGGGRLSLKPSGNEHPTGSYAGVEPGGAQPPPVPTPPGTTPPTITWPGFQMRPNGTSRVFVQSTASVPAQTSTAPGKFIVRFPGAHVAGETNRFPLETRYFNTPVTRVNIATPRDGVVLTLELRAAVTPQLSTERGPSGYYFTYIDLPAGKFVDEAPAPRSTPITDAPPTPETTNHATYLDGNLDLKAKAKAKGSVKAKVEVDTSMDNELPPSVKATSKTQGKAKASGGVKLGK